MEELDFNPDFGPASPEADALFARAAELSRPFTDHDSAARIPALVQTWAASAERILMAAETQLPLSGRRLCEWGCGLGAVSCLAARRGWSVTGFDIEPRLVAAARRFAEEAGCDVTFEVGDYFAPTGHRLDPFACDAVFVFAWPAEVSRLLDHMARHGPPDVILLLSEGAHQVRAFRQSGSATPAPRR